MRLQKRKRKFKAGSFLISIFVLIYFPSLIHWIYGKNIATDMIRIGTIENIINTDGIIIRDEEIIKSPFEGKCVINANEGDKIPVGYKIATVLDASSERMLQDVKAIDLKIINAQKERNKNRENFSEDIVKIENEINQKARLIVEASNANSICRVESIKDEINGLIQKRALIYGGQSTTDSYLNFLAGEKERLQEKIRLSTREIYSASSGIISFKVDGYENILTPGAIKDLTPKFIDNFKAGMMEETLQKCVVYAEKPFAKIIRDIECHIVFTVDSSRAPDFKEGDVIKLRVNELGKVFDSVVEYKSGEENGKTMISVNTDRGISEMSLFRKINLDIILNSYKGYKVPLGSLRDMDTSNMRAKIVLVNANYAAIKDVRIIGMDREFAVIDNLEAQRTDNIGLYSIYIINPQNIQEGQMIN